MANRARKQLESTNFEAIRNHLFDRIHRTGEEIKNDFPNILRAAIETKAWEHFQDNDGKPFKNLVDWLSHSFPNGASLGQGQNAITYEEALTLTEGHPEVHSVLAKNAPRAASGRKKNGSRTTPILARGKLASKTKPVLSARLAQEFPDIYEAYMRGEYRSIRAAAEAAGLVKPSNDPLQRLKSNWKKATAKQRKEFHAWLETDESQAEPLKKSKRRGTRNEDWQTKANDRASRSAISTGVGPKYRGGSGRRERRVVRSRGDPQRDQATAREGCRSVTA